MALAVAEPPALPDVAVGFVPKLEPGLSAAPAAVTPLPNAVPLSKLVEEEYDIEVRDGNLLVHHVPYVTSAGVVDYCILVSELTSNGERTLTPGRHEVWVVGDIPHDHRGNPVSFIADRDRLDYGGGLVASCRLSGKPHGRMLLSDN